VHTEMRHVLLLGFLGCSREPMSRCESVPLQKNRLRICAHRVAVSVGASERSGVAVRRPRVRRVRPHRVLPPYKRAVCDANGNAQIANRHMHMYVSCAQHGWSLSLCSARGGGRARRAIMIKSLGRPPYVAERIGVNGHHGEETHKQVGHTRLSPTLLPYTQKNFPDRSDRSW
jgi:hypothetical protein